MTLQNFFDEVSNNDLNKLDLLDKVEEYTHHFDLERLQFLCLDLQRYIDKLAQKESKSGEIVKVKAYLSINNKPKAREVDLSAVKNPIKFKRLAKFEQFILNKYFELKQGVKIESSKPKEEVEKSNKLLINGEKLNISERYKIANEICDIYNIIGGKNIPAADKHKLLAIILGCSQQVARALYNGVHIKRTAIRDEVITPYLESLK